MRGYITVVSGAPRSGTSLMMRMLDAGGIPAFTDRVRSSDAHNPHGYFEYEPVKRLASDSSWMEGARGKAVKIIHRLLVHLPAGFEYRIVFMDRSLTEVFDSQRTMLTTLGHESANQQKESIVSALAKEVREVKQWLASHPTTSLLSAPYAAVVREPVEWSANVSRFLGGGLDEAAMAAIADPALYHNRG
jgi:hypothetical protein